MQPDLILSYRPGEVVRVVADVHVGNHRKLAGASELAGVNTRADAVLDSLRGACTVPPHERHHGPARLIVAGDLFDTPKPTPQLIGATAQALYPGALADKGARILMVGNHDAASGAEGDHALSAMSAMPGVAIVDRPRLVLLKCATNKDAYVFAFWLLPFAPRQNLADVEAWLVELHDRLRKLCTSLSIDQEAVQSVVVSHFGIEGPKTPPYLRGHGIDGEVLDDLCAQYGFAAWVSGDWHEHTEFKGALVSAARIIQIGALAPTGFDNPGAGYGYALDFYLHDQDGLELLTKRIPGPRFHIREVDGADEARKLLTDLDNHAALIAASSPMDNRRAPWLVGAPGYVSARADEEAAKTIRAYGAHLLGNTIELVEDAPQTSRVERRAVAREVRSADSIDAALATYCAALPCPPADATTVLARCRRLLAAAKD